MAKKKRSSTPSAKYTSFKLQGKFTGHTVLISSAIAFFAGFIGGMYMQPTIVALIVSYGETHGF